MGDVLNNILDKIEERISELEDKPTENTIKQWKNEKKNIREAKKKTKAGGPSLTHLLIPHRKQK